MMRAFHGTTEVNAGLLQANILYGCESQKGSSAWTVSGYDGFFYFFPVNKINGDTLENRVHLGIGDAFNQALTTSLIDKSKTLYVFEMNIKGVKYDDDSCEGMSHCSSFIELERLKTDVKIVQIHKLRLNTIHRLIHLSLSQGLDLLNTQLIDPLEMKVARNLTPSDFACDMVEHLCNYESLPIGQYI